MTFTRASFIFPMFLAWTFGVSAAPITDAEYKASKNHIAVKLKTAKAACDVQVGHARDLCIEEAKGTGRVEMAELRANYEPSIKHTYEIQEAKAKADFAVSKMKCDDKVGNAKDVCHKEAKGAYTIAIDKAKLEKETSENLKKAEKKITNARDNAKEENDAARKAANTDIRDAEYKTALEKCNAYSGDVKAKCVTEAKTLFGK